MWVVVLGLGKLICKTRSALVYSSRHLTDLMEERLNWRMQRGLQTEGCSGHANQLEEQVTIVVWPQNRENKLRCIFLNYLPQEPALASETAPASGIKWVHPRQRPALTTWAYPRIARTKWFWYQMVPVPTLEIADLIIIEVMLHKA